MLVKGLPEMPQHHFFLQNVSEPCLWHCGTSQCQRFHLICFQHHVTLQPAPEKNRNSGIKGRPLATVSQKIANYSQGSIAIWSKHHQILMWTSSECSEVSFVSIWWNNTQEYTVAHFWHTLANVPAFYATPHRISGYVNTVYIFTMLNMQQWLLQIKLYNLLIFLHI